jgi:hypothetical protein
MRNRRDVADRDDLQPTGCQRANSHFTTCARSLYKDLDLAHAMLHGFPCGALSCNLSCVRSALARAFESRAAGACPGNCVTLRISQCHNGVVERRLDERLPAGNVLPISPTYSSFSASGTSPSIRHTSGTLLSLAYVYPGPRTTCPEIGTYVHLTERHGSANALLTDSYRVFFRTPSARFGPRRVRALVLVRWPRTGIPRRWRRPR